MEVLAVFFVLGAIIVAGIWLYTELPSGKRWIKSL